MTRAQLFGGSEPPTPRIDFHLDSADQGEQGFEMVKEAMNNGCPYAMAFVDMRMPPGWDENLPLTPVAVHAS